MTCYIKTRVDFLRRKSDVPIILLASIVLMAGTLYIPTNIQDARANPCSNIRTMGTGGDAGPGGAGGAGGDGGNGGDKGTGVFGLVQAGGAGGNGGGAGTGGEGDGSLKVKCTLRNVVINRGQ